MIRLRMVALVARRHFREILRDRRTLIVFLVAPVIFSAVMIATREEFAGQIADQSTAHHRVAVENAAGAPRLVAFLRANRLDLVEVSDAARLVRDRRVPVGLRIGRGFDDDLAGTRSGRVAVLMSEHSVVNELARAHLSGVLTAYARAVVGERLARAGLPRSAADPLRIDTLDLASPREKTGGMLATLLPLLLLTQVISIVNSIASDVTIGEKDRRTVEALLATPLRRREIATGKWIVVAGMGLTAGAVTLAATLGGLRLASPELGVASFNLIPVGAMAKALLALACSVLAIASTQLLIGIRARSPQQAGMFMMPIFLGAITPLLFFMTRSGTTVGAPFYAIPYLGPSLLMFFGLSGTAARGAPVIVTAVSMLVTAGAIVLTDRAYHSERAIQRSST